MRLIHALSNVVEIENRIPPRHWGEVSDESKAAAKSACGYCKKGATCSHGVADSVGHWLKAIVQRKPHESEWLTELGADLRREVRALPGSVPLMFDRIYWQRLNPVDVAAMMDMSAADLWTCHDMHYRTMLLSLADWFPGEAS